MRFRKTTSNELIKDLIGYDSEKLYLENIRRAEQRWTERKSHIIKVMMDLLNIEDKRVVLSSHGICYGIIILCFLSVIIITQLLQIHLIYQPYYMNII